ncbi:serine hydrolase FSH [Immersiella caudata]|uniref:Serine hydrolase FSH n=1 Tax=Immersiella caudata TaxID=314043 RepID=A0AA39WDT0_9PEZI|nr:serine hydrolase FSH [Immersiella caudata]
MMTADPTLGYPRILCLHGGGTNAAIFRLQCRSLMAKLSQFRFVFVDAPVPCPPHPAISAVYGDAHGPCYRWLRYEDEHEEVDAQEASRAVLKQCRDAMDNDDDDAAGGGTGEWVGLLGFSQGAKMAASILWLGGWLDPRPLPRPMGMDVRFRFAVLLAASAPIVLLDPTGALKSELPRHVDTADTVSMRFGDWPRSGQGDHAMGLPTLHVHGLQDALLPKQRKLVELYCKPGTARVVEWGGGHRLPFKPADVQTVADKTMEMAREAGVL